MAVFPINYLFTTHPVMYLYTQTIYVIISRFLSNCAHLKTINDIVTTVKKVKIRARERERERERERDRRTDRQTDRQTDRERERERQTE